MAGLGEACSHVASLLTHFEAFYRTREAKSCAQEQCKWLMPKAVKEVPYLPVAEIDFKGATGKMRDLSCNTEDGDSNRPTKRRKIQEPPHIKINRRQREITEPYSESFIPFGSIKNLFFQNLYSPSNAGCSLDIIPILDSCQWPSSSLALRKRDCDRSIFNWCRGAKIL